MSYLAMALRRSAELQREKPTARQGDENRIGQERIGEQRATSAPFPPLEHPCYFANTGCTNTVQHAAGIGWLCQTCSAAVRQRLEQAAQSPERRAA